MKPDLIRDHSAPASPRGLNRGHAVAAFGGLATGVLCRLLPGLVTRALIGAAVVGVALVGLAWAARRTGLLTSGAPDDPT